MSRQQFSAAKSTAADSGRNKRRRIKRIFIITGAIFLALVLSFGGYLAFKLRQLDRLAEMSFEEMLAFTTRGSENARITVGIIRDGDSDWQVYGPDSSLLPRLVHTYEIGSITKTFTSALICKAEAEGRLSLEDSIDRYLDLPAREHYPSIKELLTHSSGYKSHYLEAPMAGNFFRGRNSFFGVTPEQLLDRIGKVKPEAGSHPMVYSNFGMSVLGLVLESVYDTDYTELVDRFATNDLGLANTAITKGQGDLADYWDWQASDAYMPAGALLSDISDMLLYTQLQMEERIPYIKRSHERLGEGGMENIQAIKTSLRIDAAGAGWMMDQENGILWHNGATGHFNAYLGFDRERGLGVVILSNLPPDYRIPATVLGIELLTELQGSE